MHNPMYRKKVFLTLLVLLLLSFTSQAGITASRQNAITRAVSKCSPAVVGINVIENRVGVVRSNR